MTKLQLAQKRNYFKYVLTGIPKPIDLEALTVEEQSCWDTILSARAELLKKFDDRSKIKGLSVPEHRCWCGKEAKYTLDYVEEGKSATWVCKKHKEE